MKRDPEIYEKNNSSFKRDFINAHNLRRSFKIFSKLFTLMISEFNSGYSFTPFQNS